MVRTTTHQQQELAINLEGLTLYGNLALPLNCRAIVLFVHGSGSSRFSPRNQQVARSLNETGLGTLLFDLLTPEEQRIDERTAQHRFDIEMLSRRTIGTIDWVAEQEQTKTMRLGLFGASTGAAAALIAAAYRPQRVGAVVSRGGRPDLAGEALPDVQAPTLLLVGERDPQVIALNRDASQQMQATCQISIIPSASHLFEELGTLELVARYARDWFTHYLVDATDRLQ